MMNMTDQIELTEIQPTLSMAGCGDCMCRCCLHWWKGDCPHGECFDDYFCTVYPYRGEHAFFSLINEGNQKEHWCRAGESWQHREEECQHYVIYEGQIIRSCIGANVRVFQDGAIVCSIIDSVGCAECYKRLEERERR